MSSITGEGRDFVKRLTSLRLRCENFCKVVAFEREMHANFYVLSMLIQIFKCKILLSSNLTEWNLIFT